MQCRLRFHPPVLAWLSRLSRGYSRSHVSASRVVRSHRRRPVSARRTWAWTAALRNQALSV